MAPQPMIELNDVDFEYEGKRGRHAVQRGRSFSLRVDALRIAKGELVACIGPSGCGKTTLVNLIAGIVTPSRGTVRVNGREVSHMSDAARRRFRLAHIGLVFQEFELLEYLSARENAMLQARLLGGEHRHDAHRSVEAIAASLGISHVLDRVPRRLSQGERQRVAMCRALATRPGLVLGDEPTGNLDPDATQGTLDLLLSYAREHQATLLMVTHNHALLDQFDRVIDLREVARSSVARPDLEVDSLLAGAADGVPSHDAVRGRR